MLGLSYGFLFDYCLVYAKISGGSNHESGYGRFDLGIFQKEKGIHRLVMEFKVAEREADLEEKAREALAQIEERDYLAEFAAQGIETVWRYGVAFCGKKVKLAGIMKI